MLCRLSFPLAANPRMQDPLKRTFLRGVGKYYRPNFSSVQVGVTGKNVAAKLGANFLFHLSRLEKIVRRFVGIKEFRCGDNLPQTFTKRAFTGGDSAGDPNRRHRTNVQCTGGCISGKTNAATQT